MTELFIGVGTPQANPTVELEFQQFIREPARTVFTRLTSPADSPGERLIEYIESLPKALASFGTLELRAFAFACTASSYLVGHEREEELIEQAERAYRVQIVTATHAIRRELEGRGAHRIAMLAPYPEEICNAAVEYWAEIGFEVVALRRMDIGPDTRAIYSIEDQQLQEALADFDIADADLTLLSGTGMKTITSLQAHGTPILSSNLCLATEMLRRCQLWPPRDAADVHKLLGDD